MEAQSVSRDASNQRVYKMWSDNGGETLLWPQPTVTHCQDIHLSSQI